MDMELIFVLLLLACSPTPVPAVVGVDRIWTEQAWRGHGIAEALLNTIAAESVYGAPIVELQRRDTIAFSQPTEAGARLFKRWTGTPAFLVFT